MTLQRALHPNGSFRFLPAISAYSAGFACSDGYEVTALRLLDCPTLAIGFEKIDEEKLAILKEQESNLEEDWKTYRTSLNQSKLMLAQNLTRIEELEKQLIKERNRYFRR